MTRPLLVPLLLLAATGAAARPLPAGGVTAQELGGTMLGNGYIGKLALDSDGDPIIEVSGNGPRFRAYLSGCKGERCATVQFAAAFDLPQPVSAARINGWNRANRFGRAYVDDAGDPFVEMDVDVERGFSTEALENNFHSWLQLLERFQAFIAG